jgi:hypothetical protein
MGVERFKLSGNKSFLRNEEGEKKLENPDWDIIIRSNKNKNCLLIGVAITYGRIII